MSTWGPRNKGNTKEMKVKKGELRAFKTNYIPQFCLLLEIITFIQSVEVRWPEVMISSSHKDNRRQTTNHKLQRPTGALPISRPARRKRKPPASEINHLHPGNQWQMWKPDGFHIRTPGRLTIPLTPHVALAGISHFTLRSNWMQNLSSITTKLFYKELDL